MTPAVRARLAILGAAVLWSTSGVAIKSTALDAWQTSAGRSIVAAAVVAALLPAARAGFGSLRTLPVALAYAATTALFVLANKLTTAANAIFLQDLAPLWVLILGPAVVGERPARAETLAAPVYLAGAGLLFLEKLGPGGTLGNLVAVASGVAFALLILGLRALRDRGAEAAVLQGNVLAFLACLPLALGGPAPEPRDYAIIAFLGVFQLGIAYVLFVRGIRGVSALEASLLALLEPVLNPIWTLAILGERPGPWTIAGGAVILAATVWRTLAAPPPGGDGAKGGQPS